MRDALGAVPSIASRPSSKWAWYALFWEKWREPIAGFLMVIGLCWSYILPSIAPVHWWALVPFAMLGGMLRQRHGVPRSWSGLVPLWAFFLIVMFAVGYALSFHPLSEYGRAKAVALLVFAAAAYLSMRRQEPLTAELMHGIRWGLYATLALNLLVIYLSREFFLKQQVLGIEALKHSVSTAVLPLIVAMSVCSFIPRMVKPGPVFFGGALLLAGAVLEVFVRGRFHAGVLCVMAVVLVLGPPWRHIFWRALICAVLVVVGVAVYVNVLPLLGDSFLYLTWVSPESLAGRGPIWTIAWQGFWAQPIGHGFAGFERADLLFSYPHNVILEVAYELGIFGVLSILGIYLLTFRRAWQLWLSPPHRLLAAMTVLVFCHMLKSGDISTIAFSWVFLYLMMVCTPLSSSWPLVRGREVA